MDEILEKLKNAILHRQKINFQMADTPENEFILFLPHCIARDIFDDKLVCFGYVEKHWSHDLPIYHRMPVISGITHVDLLDETFQQIPDWMVDFLKYQPTHEVIEQIGD